jgi:deazaflavin-dependent oxidoreductase (nitroreductase family)
VTAGDAEFLYLTTTGRRSGQPREIEIWFTRHEGRYYLIAEHGNQAHWVQNLRANPQVHIRVAGSSIEATARVTDAKAEPALRGQIQALSEKKYGWGDGLIVEITPIDPA